MSNMFNNLNVLFESGSPIIDEQPVKSNKAIEKLMETDPLDLLELSYTDFVRAMLPYVKSGMKACNVVGEHDLDGDDEFWNDLYEFIAINIGNPIESSVKRFIENNGSKYFRSSIDEDQQESVSSENKREFLINSTIADEQNAISQWQKLIDSQLFTDEEIEHMKKDQQEEREHIETLKSMLNKTV